MSLGCNAKPPTDLVLNNLVVCKSAALASAKIGNLTVGQLASSAIAFVPAVSNVVLVSNKSMISGNLVQISISGTVTSDLTHDVASMEVPIGSIDSALAPLNNVFSITCQMPAGILVFALEKGTGILHTCVSGFPFGFGVYPFSLNIVYLL